jgi:hypothetical protein
VVRRRARATLEWASERLMWWLVSLGLTPSSWPGSACGTVILEVKGRRSGRLQSTLVTSSASGAGRLATAGCRPGAYCCAWPRSTTCRRVRCRWSCETPGSGVFANSSTDSRRAGSATSGSSRLAASSWHDRSSRCAHVRCEVRACPAHRAPQYALGRESNRGVGHRLSDKPIARISTS